MKDVHVWEKAGEKIITSKENPPNGLYRDDLGETRNFEDLDNDQMKITPGVIHDPEWNDHGSLFIYDFENKLWKEFDYVYRSFTNEWRLEQ